MSVRDVDASDRLERLVVALTDRKEPALDVRRLAEVKALCRQNDDCVLLAWQAAWAQLRAPHSQTRLLAVLLCEQLFERSRAFRRALCEHLAQFLEAAVGHRSERPLPPPASAASALRQKALELLEGWERQHGGRHRQLGLAVRYLRDTLQFQFPEIASRAAAAEAERAAREERQRQQLRARLAALLGGGEWREGAGAARQLLREMEECFAILAEQQAAERAAAEAARQVQQAEAAEGLEWEDVAAAQAAGTADAAGGSEAAEPAAEPAAEGLAAYAADADEAADATAEAAAAGEGGTAAELEVVLETLAGLHRQLVNRTLPQLQDWLSVLGRAEAEGPAQEQERQRALRSATELRSRLAAARQRCDAMALDLQALLLRRQRREAAAAEAAEAAEAAAAGQAGQEGQQAAAVAAAMQELFGDSSEEEEDAGAATEGATAGSRRLRSQGGAAGPATGRQQAGKQRRRQQQQQRREEDEDFVSPYLTLVDPAAPRARPAASTGKQQLPPQQQQQAPKPSVQRQSSLPEEVRRRLADQAPVLPAGLHTQFWDSKSVPTYVGGHALEVSNHWGRVDVHQELPRERVEELFLLPMPAARSQQPPAAQQPQQPQQQQQQQQQQGGSKAAGKRPAAAAVGSTSLQPWPSRQDAGSIATRAASSPAAATARPSTSAAAAAAPPQGLEAAGDARAAKRARRAQERAYNEAVIGGALSDELLARQLAEADQQQQAAGSNGASRQRGRAAKKISVRDRLAAKLLRGRAAAAAAADVARTDAEIRRDKFGNRW